MIHFRCRYMKKQNDSVISLFSNLFMHFCSPKNGANVRLCLLLKCLCAQNTSALVSGPVVFFAVMALVLKRHI